MEKIKANINPEIKELLMEVGVYQMEHFRKIPNSYGDEKVQNEFVSEIDINSEVKLKKGLNKILPEAGFYGEESGWSGSKETYWIVDPLDGTTNYLSGINQFSISIALMCNNQIISGNIYQPATKDLFHSFKGKGAYHNDKKISCPKSKLKTALIGTGFPYRSPDMRQNFFATCDDILNHTRGIRRFGSAALDVAYTAAGYLQGFWETDLQPYDIAAALLMLEEAGGAFNSVDMQKFDIFNDRLFICGSSGLINELTQIVSKNYSNSLKS